jgi:hypothetical protein
MEARDTRDEYLAILSCFLLLSIPVKKMHSLLVCVTILSDKSLAAERHCSGLIDKDHFFGVILCPVIRNGIP